MSKDGLKLLLAIQTVSHVTYLHCTISHNEVDSWSACVHILHTSKLLSIATAMFYYCAEASKGSFHVHVYSIYNVQESHNRLNYALLVRVNAVAMH